MIPMKKRLTLAATALVIGLTLSAQAATSNGNDFALYYHEANTPDKKSAVLKDAEGRPHFFRYLKILEMTEGDEGGKHYVDVTAVEPASSMNVKLRISATNSLALLKNSPETKVGDAIAVTGKARPGSIRNFRSMGSFKQSCRHWPTCCLTHAMIKSEKHVNASE